MKWKIRWARTEKTCTYCKKSIRPGEGYAEGNQYGEKQRQCAKCVKRNKLT